MEPLTNADFRIPVLLVLYDFRYLWKDNREVFVKKGEKLYLLEKTNKDWWQVVRPNEKKSFFVPAQYVEVLENEKPQANVPGSSSEAGYDDSVLYENLEDLKQKGNFDFPSISNLQRSNEKSKLHKDEKSIRKSPQDSSKQKPVPKTRTKVTSSKSSTESAYPTKQNVSDAKHLYLQNIDFHKCDKSDKSTLTDKKSQDFIFSLPKESNSSALQSDIRNCRGKSAPVAVENLVYCNVSLGDRKNVLTKHRVQPSDIQNKISIDAGKNRMKNSYNLKTNLLKNAETQKPTTAALTVIKHGAAPSGKEKPKFNHNFSKSLEKLAEEIQFEPKKFNVATKSLSAENYNKTKSVKMPKDNSEKEEKRGKTNDASVVLDEAKTQPQSRSVFSRFRRSLHHSSSFKSNNLKKLGKSSKKACELSLSWEGGLDKIQEKQEKEEKPQVTPPGLQRSRTFMFAERSPLSIRPTNKMFSVKHRLDTAYHSQRKPEEKVTLSTFKPIFNIDVTVYNKPDPVKKPIPKELIEQSSDEKEKSQSNVLEPVKTKTSGVREGKKEENSKSRSDSERSKTTKITQGNMPGYENIAKVFPNVVVPDSDMGGKTSGQKGLAFYNEPYSNSESEDNLEEKSLTVIASKSYISQSSVESNLTVSEGTEASESDENDSLDFKPDQGGRQGSDQPANKRRTSLVRSSRVESSKARKVTARLPPTPPPEQKPLKDLGGGWGAYFSNGRSYYFNEITGEKNWKPPRKTVNAQEKRLIGSHESISSDINRSDTSSPLNENCQFLNSLNRSEGSVKSATLDSASFETPNSGLASCWKEDSLDDFNRSSYNSSPIAGLSQSSAYSFNKSSRDSLNRFSPIENIPSEEEGLELQDHVYHDDVVHSAKEDPAKSEGRKSRFSEHIDTSTFHIKPGWEKFYDENLDQIYYTYKDKKEKVDPDKEVISGGLAEGNLTSENVKNDEASFEEVIYSYAEPEGGNEVESENYLENDESRDSTPKYYLSSLPSSFRPLHYLSVNNIFDSEFTTEKPPVPPKRNRKMNKRLSPQPSVAQNRKLRKAHFAKAKAVAIPTVHLRTKKIDLDLMTRSHSVDLKNENEISPGRVSEPIANNQDDLTDKKVSKKPLPFPAYDPELEYEISELLMMQRVTESSKERRRISTESKPSPSLEESNDIFQGCIKNIPAPTQCPFSIHLSHKMSQKKMCGCDMSEFVKNLPRDVVDMEGQDKVKEFLESRKKNLEYQTKPTPSLKLREDIIIDWEHDYENLSEPVVLEGKSVVKKFPDVHKTQMHHPEEGAWQDLGTNDLFDEDTFEKTLNSCCDFSTFSTEEISSLISDSSIHSQSNSMFEGNTQKGNSRFEITEIFTRCDKLLKESDPKCDTETSDKISFSSISDGLNSYSDFESDINETIAIGEIWYNEKLSEENASIISWDISEDTYKYPERREDDSDGDRSQSATPWKLYTTKVEHKFDTSPPNIFSEGKLDTIAEDEDRMSGMGSFELENDSVKAKKPWVKSSSETNLIKSKPKLALENHSKSVDFFRDSLTEGRLGLKVSSKKHDSITSDICEWMAKIGGIALAEDQLFSNDDEWILSFDSEERAYFFEESSKKSLWTLPDYSKENTKPDYNYPIQRSATESAINNETSAKLRLGKDGSQPRISASTRSSKAQSMLIEPKLIELSPKDGSKTFSMPRDLSKIYGEIIRIGVLNKTKILENGKKLRKNWTPSFVVLTDSYLFFFKDAKSFQNMKNVIGSNSNHMCLSLQGAVIEKGEKISSRKNVYKISCTDNTDVLIQTDKTSDSEEWFKEISCVIQNLPQDSTAKSSPLLDSKSPSKVGRTKSLKVRSKDTGSMEDLSSTPEERQNKIKARLKKFFIRRPTVDSLKKKGIWKDEPVFGCSLEQITKNRNPRVPVFVEKCIECIESKEENMKTDGLYRASGNLSQVQKIRLEVDQNNLNIMKEEEDVHVLTGSLKLFFRELKEPLIPSKQLEPALLATDKHTRKERIKDFQKIVKSLPTPNHDTLKFLLQHLLRVKEYHKFNRMNINNLAIVFGPTLMWPEQESANMALELMQQNVVIECLLKEFQEIFT